MTIDSLYDLYIDYKLIKNYENEIEYKSYKFSLKMFIVYNHVLNMIKNKEYESNPVNNLFKKWFSHK